MKELKNFRLSKNAIEHIQVVAKENNTNNTNALEIIIAEHKNGVTLSEELADKVVTKIENKYKNLFTRLRLGTNFTDKNVQIELELWNVLFNSLQFQNFDFKSTKEKKSDILKAAEETVKNRIAEFKQNNDNKKGK